MSCLTCAVCVACAVDGLEGVLVRTVANVAERAITTNELSHWTHRDLFCRLVAKRLAGKMGPLWRQAVMRAVPGMVLDFMIDTLIFTFK
jgi:hypothetical protein